MTRRHIGGYVGPYGCGAAGRPSVRRRWRGVTMRHDCGAVRNIGAAAPNGPKGRGRRRGATNSLTSYRRGTPRPAYARLPPPPRHAGGLDGTGRTAGRSLLRRTGRRATQRPETPPTPSPHLRKAGGAAGTAPPHHRRQPYRYAAPWAGATPSTRWAGQPGEACYGGPPAARGPTPTRLTAPVSTGGIIHNGPRDTTGPRPTGVSRTPTAGRRTPRHIGRGATRPRGPGRCPRCGGPGRSPVP